MAGTTFVNQMERLAQNLVDIFRGAGQSIRDLRVHLSALLLLKLLSDISRDAKASEGAGTWRSAWQHLRIPEECQWDSFVSSLENPELAFLLDQSLKIVSQINPETFGQTYQQIQFRNLISERVVSIEALSKAINVVSQADLRPSRFEDPEELGDFFERFQNFLAEFEGPSGEYSVPPELGSLMAASLAPRAGETVLDPFCGSGSLLSRLARHMGPESGKIIGQVRRSSDLNLCRMNLLFRGVPQPRIELSDSLKHPLREPNGQILNADIVISNPPFNSRLWSDELQELRPELFLAGMTSRSPSELLFLSHMIQVASADKGRVAVIVSNGALFRNDGKEIRKFIVEENLLSGVVALPAKLFQWTAIPVSILMLDKGKESRDVVFIDASLRFRAAKRQNVLPEAQVTQIVKAFLSRVAQPGFSNRVSLSTIRSRDYQLTVPLYVEHNEPREAAQDTAELDQQIVRIERDLASVQDELEASLRALGFPKREELEPP